MTLDLCIFLRMVAIFNFESMLQIFLLLCCTCAYIRTISPSWFDTLRYGYFSILWKCGRIGERASPMVSIGKVWKLNKSKNFQKNLEIRKVLNQIRMPCYGCIPPFLQMNIPDQNYFAAKSSQNFMRLLLHLIFI